MIDGVWTSDHHPALCGTAKFSHLLAKKLGVPVNDYTAKWPIISVRASEIFQSTKLPPYATDRIRVWPPRYDLFLHDWWNNDTSINELVSRATRIYAANEDIAKWVRQMRSDVVTLWAPSTIEGNAHRGTINVLTFGMAHKIQPAKYEKLKTLLDATGEDYTVSVSTAIHEGSPWDETALVADRLRNVFGGRLRVLGYLADDSLAREFQECTAVALFFDPALRGNNTSFWAAVDSGQTIITNVDAESPIVSGVFSIDHLEVWPEVSMDTWALGTWDRDERYSWMNLVAGLRPLPCVK